MGNGKNDEHGGQGAGGNGQDKTVTIIVNGQRKEVKKEKISFEELVVLAFGSMGGGNTIYTITYRKGEVPKHEGSLVAGESVKVKEGMIFNVTPTDKS